MPLQGNTHTLHQKRLYGGMDSMGEQTQGEQTHG